MGALLPLFPFQVAEPDPEADSVSDAVSRIRSAVRPRAVQPKAEFSFPAPSFLSNYVEIALTLTFATAFQRPASLSAAMI